MRKNIFVLLLLISCGVKQPVDFTAQKDLGRIYVDSNPTGAVIFMDGVNTLHVTPDTLSNIPLGSHFFSVYKEGYTSATDSFTVEIKKDSLTQIQFILNEISYKGSLYVTSEPEGAEIIVDGRSTGKQTPDTLQLESGVHDITLKKNGFADIKGQSEVATDSVTSLSYELDVFPYVLMESFGNVSCVPCVQSAVNLEAFRENHPDGAYALLEYYANWPSSNDPFYLEAPRDVDERVSYYRVFTLPTLKMNGTQGVDAQDSSAIESAYASALAAQNTQLGLSVQKSKQDDSVAVSVEIYDYDNVLSNDQLRLFVLITENEIHLESAPGANGLKDFNFVFRGFLSDKKGLSIDKTRFYLSRFWPAEWRYEHSRIIAFVQDISTKQIIQATIN